MNSTTGVPGSDPEDGDLIYYAPWGDIGFYCNAAGMGHDDGVIHLGTYQASEEQLAALETHPSELSWPTDNCRTPIPVGKSF